MLDTLGRNGHRTRTADAHATPARNALAIIAVIAPTACGESETVGEAGSVVTVMAGTWVTALAGEAARSARGSALSAFTTSSEEAIAPKTAAGRACANAAGRALCECGITGEDVVQTDAACVRALGRETTLAHAHTRAQAQAHTRGGGGAPPPCIVTILCAAR